jgi:ADP-L-glycero-D-manno-heptose 6-epimerase
MIIVTGGAGFLGSNLVAGLQDRGVTDIVVCDVFGTDDKWRNIAKRELQDIVHPDNLMAYLEEHSDEIHAIFHMGAISSTTETDADRIIDNNIRLSRNLWRWCAKNYVRFIYASSAATYGDGTKGFADDSDPESLSQLKPLNLYGWSKHVFDRRVSRLVQQKENANEKLPPQWAGLKFFNVYGPNEYHKGEQKSVACKLYPQVVAGATAKLFKSENPKYQDGGQIRDFVWVGDCVDVMLWLYDNQQVSGLFNVGSGEGRSFKDLATAVFTAAGKPPKISYMDMPNELRERYQYYTKADISKLRAAGYDKPMTSLEDGVAQYVQTYLSRADHYR